MTYDEALHRNRITRKNAIYAQIAVMVFQTYAFWRVQNNPYSLYPVLTLSLGHAISSLVLFRFSIKVLKYHRIKLMESHQPLVVPMRFTFLFGGWVIVNCWLVYMTLMTF